MVKSEEGTKLSVKPDDTLSHRRVQILRPDGTEEVLTLMPYDAEVLASEMHHATLKK